MDIIKQHTEVLRKQQEWIVRHGDNASIHDLLPDALQFALSVLEKLEEEKIYSEIDSRYVDHDEDARQLAKEIISYLGGKP